LDEFLERQLPESRRKAYCLMSIHEHLSSQVRRELKPVGWTKGLELAKVVRRDGWHFDYASWLHKAWEMLKEDLKRDADKELAGKVEEPISGPNFCRNSKKLTSPASSLDHARLHEETRDGRRLRVSRV